MHHHRWTPGTLVALMLTLTLGALSALLPVATTVHAAGQVGNGTPASCTESALQSALNGGGSVTFNCGSDETTITLSKHLTVAADTVLNGGDKIILSGGDQTTVLRVNANLNVTIQNLTIQDGRDGDPATVTQSAGAWIVTGATVTFDNVRFYSNDATASASERGAGAIGAARATRVIVRNCEFIDNTGTAGGAMNILLTPVLIEGSLFRGNTATVAKTPANAGYITGFGGALFVDGAGVQDGVPGELTIRNSIFENNEARDQGGALAIFCYVGDVFTIETSSFIANRAGSPTIPAIGGAIRHGSAPMTIRDSTFQDNVSYGNGGAISAANSGTLYPSSFTNLTMVGNRAEQGPPGTTSLGGALSITQGTYTLTNVTLANNYAATSGGAILGGSTAIAMNNTIVAGNTSPDSRQCRITAAGANNIQFPPSSFNCTPGIVQVDPLLNDLASNGGPSQTMALASGSPAINAGDILLCPETDQRLADRIGNCDIGAFEFGGVPPLTFAPNVPVLHAVANGGKPIVAINWGRVTRTLSYNLELVATGPGIAPGMVGTTKTTLHFGLNSGSYQARVQACNLSGCSDYSDPLIITVTSDPLRNFLPSVVR